MPLEGRKKGRPERRGRRRRSPGTLSVCRRVFECRAHEKKESCCIERTYGKNVVVDDAHAEHRLEESVRELRLSR